MKQSNSTTEQSIEGNNAKFNLGFWRLALIFEFGKYTEITDFVLSFMPNHYTQGYIRYFICADVLDFWLIRVQKDVNDEYEPEDGVFLLERDKIAMDHKGEKLTITKVKEIIENDDLSNWDNQQYDNLEDLIDDIDGGFGINNLKD